MKNVKILSVLFALVLMFSLFSVSVFAEAEAETTAAEAAEAVEDASDEEEAVEEHSGFEPMNFIKNLKYMGVGMLCIIIVIGVLIGVTIVLNKVTAKKK